MWAERIAAGGLIAGLALTGWGLVTRGDPRPASPPTRTLAGVTFLQPEQGQKPIDEIVAFWRGRARDNEPDYLSRTELGRALSIEARETGDPTGYLDAEAALGEALELNPSHQPARLALASVLAAQHRFDEARQLARSVRALDPSSLSALAVVGDTSFELGDYQAAGAAYDQLAAVDGTAPVLARLARLAWVEGDARGAVELSDAAREAAAGLALRPHDAAHYPFQAGHFRFVVGDYEGAIEALDEALRIAPGHLGAMELLAHVQASTGDLEGAAILYRDLLDRSPAADLHGAYADVLRMRGDGRGAAEQERLGIELARATLDDPAERRHVAGFLTTRDPDLAVTLAEADWRERRDVGALDTLAWALHHAGRHEEADVHMTAALDVGAVDASLLYHAGAIRVATGQVDSARQLLGRALALSPRFDPVDAGLAAQMLELLA